MNCPHCNMHIRDAMLAQHLAAKGGAKSKRGITAEQQAKMQKGRKK